MRICVRQMNDWKRANIRVSVGVNLHASRVVAKAALSASKTNVVQAERQLQIQ